MPSHDPRLNLDALRAEDLYAIAVNPAAAHRDLAIQILVERGSLFALKDDIAEESRQYVLDNPIVLKKIDPAAAVTALSMPGVIECIADAQQKRKALARVVSEHNAAHIGHIAALETAVANNKVAGDHALHDACATLWRYVLKQAWQGVEDAAPRTAELKTTIAELRAEHAQDITAAAERLRLLERSPWRKLVDWWAKRSRFRKSEPATVLTEQDEDAAFQTRMAEMIRKA